MSCRVWNLSKRSRSTSRFSTASSDAYARISAGAKRVLASRLESTEDTNSSCVALPRVPKPEPEPPLKPDSPIKTHVSISTKAAETVGCRHSAGRDKSWHATRTRLATLKGGDAFEVPDATDARKVPSSVPSRAFCNKNSALPLRSTKHTQSEVALTNPSGTNANAARVFSGCASSVAAKRASHSAWSNANPQASRANAGSSNAAEAQSTYALYSASRATASCSFRVRSLLSSDNSVCDASSSSFERARPFATARSRRNRDASSNRVTRTGKTVWNRRADA
mmetsp:Transcript_8041/g.33620  ORF Transcript_8041/g.33620 Transcript_8041/m.33620 type:complete len:281 (+) Transcript_8041:1877-2719(+)